MAQSTDTPVRLLFSIRRIPTSVMGAGKGMGSAMGVNAHRAFDNTSDESYRRNLTPANKDLEELRRARDAIRETLKRAFSAWEERIETGVLFESAAVRSFSHNRKPNLSPKFRGQGSYVYATLNQPSHNPPQEMDFDDGMFLPTSFMSENGNGHPIIASNGYFALVEAALRPLCDKEGWSLNPGRTRPSCVRVGLNNGRSHIDIALYAIPDDEYGVLVEKAATWVGHSRQQSAVDPEALFESVYPTIPVDQIMLAHRVDGWKVSDPRKLEDWFLNAVRTHGEQLRRVARYLKGWRDHTWKKCRLSSIALMSCVVRFFEESRNDYVGRDDLALQAIATRLATYLAEEIPNPVVAGRLDEGWDDGDNPCRKEFVAQALLLQHAIENALSQRDADNANSRLREIFGAHFPRKPSLISDEKAPIEFKSAAAAAGAAVIGISAAEQAARAQSAAAALRNTGLASKPWGSASDE